MSDPIDEYGPVPRDLMYDEHGPTPLRLLLDRVAAIGALIVVAIFVLVGGGRLLDDVEKHE